MSTDIRFVGLIGGNQAATFTNLLSVQVEVGGDVLREWLLSRLERRDPAGWIAPTVPFFFFCLDLRNRGITDPATQIDDDELYLCEISDGAATGLGATDVDKWCPSLKLIASAVALAKA